MKKYMVYGLVMMQLGVLSSDAYAADPSQPKKEAKQRPRSLSLVAKPTAQPVDKPTSIVSSNQIIFNPDQLKQITGALQPQQPSGFVRNYIASMPQGMANASSGVIVNAIVHVPLLILKNKAPWLVYSQRELEMSDLDFDLAKLRKESQILQNQLAAVQIKNTAGQTRLQYIQTKLAKIQLREEKLKERVTEVDVVSSMKNKSVTIHANTLTSKDVKQNNPFSKNFYANEEKIEIESIERATILANKVMRRNIVLLEKEFAEDTEETESDELTVLDVQEGAE